MDQRNLILAIVISLAILLAYEFLIGGPQREQLAQQQARQQAEQGLDTAGAPPAGQAPSAPGVVPQQPGQAGPMLGGVPAAAREAALEGPRVAISTPTLEGSISLIGGRLDDLVLAQYREAIEPESPNIVLFHPVGSPLPYYADFGWITTEGEATLPAPDTLWQASASELTPDQPVTLSWDNGEGLIFERSFALDEDYMLSVTQRVRNEGEAAVSLAAYGLVSRSGTPETLGFFILHEGLIGSFDGTLKELDYDDVVDSGVIQQNTTGGWIGITDKYWMATLVPEQDQAVGTRFVHDSGNGVDKYQADYLYGAVTVPPGGEAVKASRLFAGAKKVTLLDSYRDDLGIENFDKAVDFGWFYFLTKPIFLALHWIHGIVGNFGVSIMILTVVIKLLFFPLANKSYRAMAKMRKLQPQMLELRERFPDDKQRMNQELMALYKQEGANPVAGCLPIIIQIPVFFALYKVLFVTIEMRQAPFFGWIQDLSVPDPTSILNLFGLLPFSAPDLGAFNMLNLGIWPLAMGLSMFAQQRLNPQPADPMQAKIFLAMPIVFTFLLASFPAGLVIYWTWNNLLSILQQYVIMRRAGVPIGSKAAAKAAAAPSPQAGTRAAGKRGPAASKPEPEGGKQGPTASKPKPAGKRSAAASKPEPAAAKPGVDARSESAPKPRRRSRSKPKARAKAGD